MKGYRFIIMFLVFIVVKMFSHDSVSADEVFSAYGLSRQPVYVYYFYFTPRCEECLIVEKALIKVLNEYYSQELKNQQLIYKAINLTNPDPESKKIAQNLKVRRQLLLIVSGDTILNLTRDAFRYAENQYELFRSSMKNSIDQVLSQ
jgi:hypothetical protein